MQEKILAELQDEYDARHNPGMFWLGLSAEKISIPHEETEDCIDLLQGMDDEEELVSANDSSTELPTVMDPLGNWVHVPWEWAMQLTMTTGFMRN